MRYYKRVNDQGKTTTVESYSHDSPVEGALETTKEEFDAFIASLPPVITPPVRDFLREFDSLIAKLKAKGIIT